VPVSLGRELDRRSRLRMIGALGAGAAAAIVGMLRLMIHVVRRRIDVIHTTDRPRDALATVLLGKLTRVPTIVHCHVAYGEWMSRPLRWALRHADHLVGVSQFVADTLVDAGHAPQRVHVVLNAIEVQRWTPGVGRDEARRSLGFQRDDQVVLTVCRLFPEKGAAELIRACAALRPSHPRLRVVVAGDDVTPQGWFSAELRRLVDELEIADAVTFLAHQSDVRSLFAAADVFAMPSHGEPFGLVFLEAMAMRVPVVGVADGGTVEVVDDGRDGVLVPYRDVDALARAIARLLADESLRRDMGRSGRRRVETTFTMQRLASDAAEVYAQALNEPRGDYVAARQGAA
jgi:glycosyltransferase involved in cell wall biosynthesis